MPDDPLSTSFPANPCQGRLTDGSSFGEPYGMTPEETLAAELDVLADLNHAVQDDGYPSALDRVRALRMIAETAERALRQAVPLARQEGASC